MTGKRPVPMIPKVESPMSKKQTSIPPEERRAEAATIGWMLATLATLAALVCSLAAYAVVRPMADPPLALALLPGLLLTLSAITGLVGVLLTPLVLRLRKTRPPRLITQFAVVVGLTPSVLLIAIEWLL